jgi:hypothetical protein
MSCCLRAVKGLLLSISSTRLRRLMIRIHSRSVARRGLTAADLWRSGGLSKPSRDVLFNEQRSVLAER